MKSKSAPTRSGVLPPDPRVREIAIRELIVTGGQVTYLRDVMMKSYFTFKRCLDRRNLEVNDFELMLQRFQAEEQNHKLEEMWDNTLRAGQK